MEEYMKKIAVIFLFLIVLPTLLFAQTINRTEYQSVTFDDYLFLRDTGEAVGKKYVLLAYYNSSASSGATVYLMSTLNTDFKSISGSISRRYDLQPRQLLTVYVTCASKFSTIIDDIVIGNLSQSQTKPWQPFILNNRSNLHGWFLEDLGNGTYREVYFE